ncbi:MAG: hypothetical protein HYU64_05275 [Armatimonadetes bacterium]|nr:hypothetical protein [Armatimonadota bacterium]
MFRKVAFSMMFISAWLFTGCSGGGSGGDTASLLNSTSSATGYTIIQAAAASYQTPNNQNRKLVVVAFVRDNTTGLLSSATNLVGASNPGFPNSGITYGNNNSVLMVPTSNMHLGEAASWTAGQNMATFYISSFGGSGSTVSRTAESTYLDAPANVNTPQNPSASQAIVIQWGAVPGATGYSVTLQPASGATVEAGTINKVTAAWSPLTVPTYTVPPNTLVAGVTYSVKVQAYNANTLDQLTKTSESTAVNMAVGP